MRVADRLLTICVTATLTSAAWTLSDRSTCRLRAVRGPPPLGLAVALDASCRYGAICGGTPGNGAPSAALMIPGRGRFA